MTTEPPSRQQREQGKISFEQASDATLLVRLSGPWCLRGDMPSASLLNQQLITVSPRTVAFDSAGLTNWDSALISF
ncbi:MAG: hypothetical protein ACREQT_07135, partial [Candidatus Binataceae bacterium]